jgi:hypothetical protein
MTMDKKELIAFLRQGISEYSPWVQKKEITAWTSTTFYLLMLSVGFKFVYDNHQNEISLLYLVISVGFIILLWFIIFKFIHAQFASIYDLERKVIIHSDIIIKLIFSSTDFIKNNNISNQDDFNKYVKEKKEDIKNDVSKSFMGKCHPCLIIVYFWKYIFPFCFIKYIIRKIYEIPKSRKLSNFERQEAALYSISILLSIIICVLLIHIYIYPIKPQ